MTTDNQIFEDSHRRFNVLTGEWIQVSPHRMKRPWQGSIEKLDKELRPQYDPNCYLCPENERAGGERNPQYEDTLVFTNDFAAINPDLDESHYNEELLIAKTERGVCRVICFSPRHDLTIPELSEDEVKCVVKTWVQECVNLSKLPFINHIQIFENKGAVMGCSNPHPHGQIWGQESIPVESTKKQQQQSAYFQKNKKTLLSAYLAQELILSERVLHTNDHFLVLVPFWSAWPYEAMIAPKRPMAHISEMTEEEITSFAECYRHLTIIYDNLFKTSFPYSAGIHQAPFDGEKYSEWHWHMVFFPPLLRSETIKKFMVGYEMLANPQRDLTPEQAAAKLIHLPVEHYKQLIEAKNE